MDADTSALAALSATGKGSVLRCTCRPGRPATRIDGIHGDMLRVDLAAPPEDGKANAELLKLLTRILGLPAARVVLKSGQSARKKSVHLEGLAPDEAATLISPWLAPAR